jgi:small subunit ribosomal protein S21
MLIIEIKDGESIDKALKRYKRKVQNTGMIKELRRRKEFVKPSVQRRNQVLKAVYREKVREEQTNA